MKMLLSLIVVTVTTQVFGQTQTEPTSQHNYVTVYVESNDTLRIDAFIAEMKSYSNKVVHAGFNYSTHEFTVVYTHMMRDDTIYQILLEYFGQIKKIAGTFIPETE